AVRGLGVASDRAGRLNPREGRPSAGPTRPGRSDDMMREHFFVGWGTLALINAGLAQGKNRSGLNWFLLSLLLGPIATFVLVAFMDKLPDDQGSREKRTLEL